MTLARVLIGVTLVLAVPTTLDPTGALASAAYVAGLGLIVAVLWIGSSRWTGPTRTGWRCIAAAATCWLAGDILQRVLELVGHPFEQAAPSDLFWLASYPLVVIGVGSMIRGRRIADATWRDIRLDIATITVAGAAGAWKIMIQPGIDGGGIDLDTVLVVLYPLGDVAILGVAMGLLMTQGRRSRASDLLLACFGSTLVLDAAYAVLPTLTPSFDVAHLDGSLLLVNAMLAAAVVQPTAGDLGAPSSRIDEASNTPRWRVVMLGFGLVFITLVPALPAGASPTLDRAVLLAAAATVSLTILWRVYGVMSDRDAAEALLRFQAHHDQLTGLANRALLVDRVAGALGDVDRTGDITVSYLDLDGFKAINDRWGHAAGDHVLRVTSDRLRHVTRVTDTVARLGGDEFVVVSLPARDGADDADAIGNRLRDAVGRPIVLPDGVIVSVGVSVGVHVARRGELTTGTPIDHVEGILRAADDAMYRAKHAEREVQQTGRSPIRSADDEVLHVRG